MEFVKKNALGILICLVIAVPAWLLGQRFEVVGGPVFAILIGMVIALFWKDQKSAKSGITYTSPVVWRKIACWRWMSLVSRHRRPAAP